MPIMGVMRIKNEARWIDRVIESQLPAVEALYIMDDHSTDQTREICRSYDRVKLFESPFQGLDESRDKQWILEKIFDDLPANEIHGHSPWWVLALDGDEILEEAGPQIIHRDIQVPEAMVYSLRVLYLWDREDQIRVDGVYRNFRRPSLFRLQNRMHRYQKTPFGNGANFHCSSIPQDYLHWAVGSSASVYHLGYLTAEIRRQKFEWYNTIDPGNEGEDCYRHMLIGDIPELPATAKTRWAGPLELQPI